MTLATVSAVLKDHYLAELNSALWGEEALQSPYIAGGEHDVTNITINAKLSLYGCPACMNHGNFEAPADKDMIHCHSCDTWFTGQWLVKWDGTHTPAMKGTQGPAPVDPPFAHNPIKMDSMGQKLLDLQEKVVLFREAVVNPDRVTSDEDIETLLREMFDVSYTLPMPLELYEEITPEDDIDSHLVHLEAHSEMGKMLEQQYGLGPELSGDSFAEQLQQAIKDDLLSPTEAAKMLEAFGTDPFPTEGEADGMAG